MKKLDLYGNPTNKTKLRAYEYEDHGSEEGVPLWVIVDQYDNPIAENVVPEYAPLLAKLFNERSKP